MSLLRHHQLLMSASEQGDPFFANVELLYHNESIIQPGPPAIVTDSSINMRNTPTSVGIGVTKSSAVFKYGANSMRMQGTNNSSIRVIFNSSGLPVPGTQDFCIECWFRTELNDTFPSFFNIGNTGSNGFYFAKLSGPNVLYVQKPGTDLQGTTTVATGVWHHVAFARSGGVSRIFLNGGLEGSIADANNYSSTNSRELFGSFGGTENYYIDEFRYTIGHGRYAAAFTPPDGPFPDF